MPFQLLLGQHTFMGKNLKEIDFPTRNAVDRF